MDIKVNIENAKISQEEIKQLRPQTGKTLDALWSGKGMTGWVQAPLHTNQEEQDYILNVADIIKQEAEMMVVIGTDAATLAARAAIEALPNQQDGIDVRFAGQNFCTAAMNKLINEMIRRGTILCVISRTGEEPEVQAALSVLRELMLKKYESKENVSRRTIVITEAGSPLHKEAQEEGYIVFDYPTDSGELYSALTPAGLFPMSVAGIEVREFIRGAKVMATSPQWDSDGADYAIVRALAKQANNVERISTFDTRFEALCQWMRELYKASSDGKMATMTEGFYGHAKGTGIFETIISADKCEDEIAISDGALAGRTLAELNAEIFEKALESLKQSDCAMTEIRIPEVTPFHYGQLVYFLQTTCDITAAL